MKRETRATKQPLTENGRTIAGYAAVFDSPTTIPDMFEEVIAPGAFTRTLGSNSIDVLALFGHNVNQPLGRQSAGTLRLSQDERGLAVEIDLPDTQAGRDAAQLIARRDIQGMSFGFSAIREEWDESRMPPRRTILEAELYEVSITAAPAYDDTDVAMRSLNEARQRTAGQDKHARRQGYARRRALTEQRFRGIASGAV